MDKPVELKILPKINISKGYAAYLLFLEDMKKKNEDKKRQEIKRPTPIQTHNLSTKGK